MNEETSSTATASYTYANWERERGGEACQETIEAILFTDTWVTGEIPKLGPYAFLNTLARASVQFGKVLRPAVVMRVSHHYGPTTEQSYLPMENDFEHYHGGDYLDEMAALASLFLGARLKAGSVNRAFRNDADRFGRPVQYGSKPEPQLLLEGRPQIPRLSQPVNLNATNTDGIEYVRAHRTRGTHQLVEFSHIAYFWSATRSKLVARMSEAISGRVRPRMSLRSCGLRHYQYVGRNKRRALRHPA